MPKDDIIKVTFNTDIQTIEKLDNIAKSKDRKRSEIIRILIKEYIKKELPDIKTGV